MEDDNFSGACGQRGRCQDLGDKTSVMPSEVNAV